MFYRQKSNK